MLADDIGAVLRAWRASAGRSQAEAAGLLGMTQQNLSQIENGRQTMSYEQRQRAVSVLGISAEDLGLSPGRPRAELDATVAIDQARWRHERRWLNQHRSELARLAVELYPVEHRVPDMPSSRPSYRLLGKQLGTGSLHFGLAAYFDKLDVSEALGHELAIACFHRENGLPDSVEPLRGALPFRTHRRPFRLCPAGDHPRGDDADDSATSLPGGAEFPAALA